MIAAGEASPNGEEKIERVTLEIMIAALEADATRMETTNQVLAERGWPTRPSQAELDLAKIWRATEKFLRRISEHRDEVKAILGGER